MTTKNQLKKITAAIFILMIIQIGSAAEGAQILSPSSGDQFKESFDIDLEAEYYVEDANMEKPEVTVNIKYPNGNTENIEATQSNGKLFKAKFNSENKPVGTYTIQGTVNYGSGETAQTSKMNVVFDNEYTGDRNPEFNPSRRSIEWPEGKESFNMSILLDESSNIPEGKVTMTCSTDYPESTLNTETAEINGQHEFNCEIPGFFSTYTDTPAVINVELCDSLGNCFNTKKEYVFQKEKEKEDLKISSIDYPPRTTGKLPVEVETNLGSEITTIAVQTPNTTLEYSDLGDDAPSIEIPEEALVQGLNSIRIALEDVEGRRTETESIETFKPNESLHELSISEESIKLKKGESKEIIISLTNNGGAFIGRQEVDLIKGNRLADVFYFEDIKINETKEKEVEISSSNEIGESSLSFETDRSRASAELITNPSVQTYVKFTDKYDKLVSRTENLKENISKLNYENKTQLVEEIEYIDGTLNETDNLGEDKSYRYVSNIRNSEKRIERLQKAVNRIQEKQSNSLVAFIAGSTVLHLLASIMVITSGGWILYDNHRNEILTKIGEILNRLTEDVENHTKEIEKEEKSNNEDELSETSNEEDDKSINNEEDTNSEDADGENDVWHLP